MKKKNLILHFTATDEIRTNCLYENKMKKKNKYKNAARLQMKSEDIIIMHTKHWHIAEKRTK